MILILPLVDFKNFVTNLKEWLVGLVIKVHWIFKLQLTLQNLPVNLGTMMLRIQPYYILHTKCIYVLQMYLRTNNDLS